MSATAETTPLLSVREAAARLGVSVATIRRWIDAGELPAFKLGGSVRVDPAELAAWLEHRKVAA